MEMDSSIASLCYAHAVPTLIGSGRHEESQERSRDFATWFLALAVLACQSVLVSDRHHSLFRQHHRL